MLAKNAYVDPRLGRVVFIMANKCKNGVALLKSPLKLTVRHIKPEIIQDAYAVYVVVGRSLMRRCFGEIAAEVGPLDE